MKDHNPDHLPTTSVADRLSAWFVCFDGDKTLRAWCSFYTGKEIIYLDEHVMSEKRSLKKDSMHTFMDGESIYRVQYNIINQLTGKLECRFYKNQTLLKASRMEFKKGFSIEPISFSGKRGLLIVLYAFLFAILYFCNVYPAYIGFLLFLFFAFTQLFQPKLGTWQVKDLES